MKTIPMSRSLRSAIYQAARKRVGGASPLFEAGLRHIDASGTLSANARLWLLDADLVETVRLSKLTRLDLDDKCLCELDLYAYTGHGSQRELETNVYVLVCSTEVFDVADVGDRHLKNWDEFVPVSV